VLKDHLWQRRIVEAKRKQLFEPTRRRPSFPRNRVEKSEQHATSGLTRPVAPFGGRPGLDEIEPTPPSRCERAPHRLHRAHDRAQIAQRDVQAGARETRHADNVATIER